MAAISDRLVDYDRVKGFLVQRRRLMADHPGVPMMLGELELTAHKFDERQKIDRIERMGDNQALRVLHALLQFRWQYPRGG